MSSNRHILEHVEAAGTRLKLGSEAITGKGSGTASLAQFMNPYVIFAAHYTITITVLDGRINNQHVNESYPDYGKKI